MNFIFQQIFPAITSIIFIESEVQKNAQVKLYV